MSTTFKNVAYVFFLGFGAFYLTSDFLINQGQAQSETLQLIYKTFDMPFFFSAGMYALAAGYGQLKKKYNMGILSPLFWALAFAWTVLLISLNFGFESFL